MRRVDGRLKYFVFQTLSISSSSIVARVILLTGAARDTCARIHAKICSFTAHQCTRGCNWFAMWGKGGDGSEVDISQRWCAYFVQQSNQHNEHALQSTRNSSCCCAASIHFPSGYAWHIRTYRKWIKNEYYLYLGCIDVRRALHFPGSKGGHDIIPLPLVPPGLLPQSHVSTSFRMHEQNVPEMSTTPPRQAEEKEKGKNKVHT